MSFPIAKVQGSVESAVAARILNLHRGRVQAFDDLIRSCSLDPGVQTLDDLWRRLDGQRSGAGQLEDDPRMPARSPIAADRLTAYLTHGADGEPALLRVDPSSSRAAAVSLDQIRETARVLLAVDAVRRAPDAFPDFGGSLPGEILAGENDESASDREPTRTEREILFTGAQVAGWDGGALLEKPRDMDKAVFFAKAIASAKRVSAAAGTSGLNDPPEHILADMAAAARQASGAGSPKTMRHALRALDALNRLVSSDVRRKIAVTSGIASANLHGLATLHGLLTPAAHTILATGAGDEVPEELLSELLDAARLADRHLRQRKKVVAALEKRQAERLAAVLPPPDGAVERGAGGRNRRLAGAGGRRPSRRRGEVVDPVPAEAPQALAAAIAPGVAGMAASDPGDHEPAPIGAFALKAGAAVSGGSEGFLLSEIGTIDMWIRADWDRTQSEPACILHLAGTLVNDDGLRLTGKGQLSLFISGNQTELSIVRTDPDAAGGFAIDKVPHDLSDGKFHHVLVCLTGSEGVTTKIRVAIDGADPVELGADASSGLLPQQDFELAQVEIGASEGKSAFEGLVRRLVFWSGARLDTTAFDQGTPGNGAFGLLRFAGGSAVFDLLDDPAGFWTLDSAKKRFPLRLTLPGVAPEDHAQYDSPPYLGITARDGGWVLVSDDGGFTPLVLKAGAASTFAGDSESNFPGCVIRAVREVSTASEGGRTVRNAIPQLIVETDAGTLKAGDYSPADRGVEDAGKSETWGSAFLKMPANMEFSLRSWDVTLMDARNSMSTGACNYVLGFPLGLSKRYTFVTSDDSIAMPFGFAFVPNPKIQGTMKQTVMSSGQDVKDSISVSSGLSYHVEAGFETEFGGADASFRHHKNQSAESEAARMYDKEVMYSVHTIRGVAHEVILDKAKVALAGVNPDGTLGGFSADVIRLSKKTITAREFIRRYGTHYPYTIAYGARIHQMNTYTKESASSLVASKTSVEEGFGASLKVNAGFMGVNAGVGGGVDFDSSEAKAQSAQLKSTLKDDVGGFEAYGGDGWHSDDALSDVRSNPVPVMVTLRPITELLGPPFFRDFDIAVTARSALATELKTYLAQPSGAQAARTDLAFVVPGFAGAKIQGAGGGD